MKGYSSNMDAVLGTDGTFLMAPSSVPNVSGKKEAKMRSMPSFPVAPGDAKAWWFPDSGLFIIPNALNL